MSDITTSPSYSAAQAAKADWLAVHNNPNASAQEKASKQAAYRRLMIACNKEAGNL